VDLDERPSLSAHGPNGSGPFAPSQTQAGAAPALVGGRYAVRREIASGGICVVYEAEHLVTQARVALKLLHPAYRNRADQAARLLRESRLLARLRHPSIVTIHDAGECREHGPFLALELIDGRPLDGVLLARRTLGVEQAVGLGIHLCEALEAAHAAGIVHRDVKPSNVLLCARAGGGSQVKLIDFGVAAGSDGTADARRLTRVGDVVGTLEYMAPEQLMESSPVDARSDVYAVGVLLYECLSGRFPYEGSATALITAFVRGTPVPRLERADVPPALFAVLERALRIDPSARFASAAELGAALAAALAAPGGPPPAPALRVLEPAAPASRPEQRRAHARAPYVAPTRIVLASGAVHDGRTEDISEGGVLVVTDTPCGTGERVKMRLPLPAAGRVVTLEGVTRWVRTVRGRQAIGVAFDAVPPDVAAEIRVYVQLVSGQRPTQP
jgi:tRNA A-37 threonylcarbamoyl transferase component Bud32